MLLPEEEEVLGPTEGSADPPEEKRDRVDTTRLWAEWELAPAAPEAARVHSGDPDETPRNHWVSVPVGVGGLIFGAVMARALSTGRREVQRVQRATLDRLQRKAGLPRYTRTPHGRMDALEATALTIPAAEVYHSLDATLTWIHSRERRFFSRNWRRLMSFAGLVGMRAASVPIGPLLGAILTTNSSAAFKAHVAGKGVVPASDKDLQRLGNAFRRGRGSVIHAFPHIREIVLTDPNTGADRPWPGLRDMVRADRSLLAD